MGNAPDENDARRDHVRIVEEAACWFARLNDGKPSRRHRDAFGAWLCSDPRHGQAYEDIQRLWSSAGELPVLKEHGAALAAKTATRRQLGAAVLVVAAGALGWRYAATLPGADLETATGEKHSVILPDGSEVDLAAQTRIMLAFEPEVRRIVLLEGEAFFRVAAEAGRPFIVEAGGAHRFGPGDSLFGIALHANGPRCRHRACRPPECRVPDGTNRSG